MTDPTQSQSQTGSSAKPSPSTHAQVRYHATSNIPSATPPAVVRVRNLQGTLTGPQDAWGRSGRPQPVLISIEVWLHEPFEMSSATDAVGDDTVHYGKLSKAVQGTLKRLDGEVKGGEESRSLRGCMAAIWQDLTGHEIDGSKTSGATSAPFLKTKEISLLRVAIKLPKASLLGDGVSLDWASSFVRSETGDGVPFSFATALSAHGLRIPTLIGVNANEREAKQMVTATLEVEEIGSGADVYRELEAAVVRTMEDSSFETLEALAQTTLTGLKEKHAEKWAEDGPWTFNVIFEKPIAVPYADAACVELRMRTSD